MSLKENAEKLRQIIVSRRSIRVFKKKPVSVNKILKVLGYGIWAPSAHNSQPWRFIVIKDRAVRQTLIEKMTLLYESDMKKDALLKEEVERRILKSRSMLSEPHALILACLDKNALWSYSDRERAENEFIMGVQSVAAAIQNILLGAHVEGLGACWMCAPLFCRNLIRDSLNLPESYIPQAFIVIGYPAEQPSPPPRTETPRIIKVINHPLK